MDICLTKNEKRIFYCWVRQFVYFFLLLGVALSIWYLADEFGARAFIEGGIVENIQCFVLVLAGVFFVYLAYKNKAYRAGILGLASLCVFGVFREQDALFDELLPVVSWKFCFLFPILALLNGFRNVKAFKKQVFDILSMPSFYMMFAAMMIVIPVAQCLGHKPLMAAILDADSVHLAGIIRRMVEESSELMGYVIILLSVFELSLNLRERLSK